MATNPMQRKARNSFLLGVLLMGVILVLVVAFFVMQIKTYKDKEAQQKAQLTTVYVLKQDVKSGQIITTDMYEQKTTQKDLVPSNAINNMTILSNYSLTDKDGNEIITEYKNNESKLYLVKDGQKNELIQDDTSDKENSYYINNKNEQKEYIQLSTTPVIAKIDMNKNTVITLNMITKSDEKTTNDLRKVEYNMITLPMQIQTDDYIDVRLSLPSGQDYIVVSKKQVEIPQINGVDSEDTIWIKLTEEEIILMNNAIVEAYNIPGAMIKAVTYTEAGVQDKATPTYVPSAEVAQLIQSDPNIIQTAKNALITRYNEGSTTRSAISSNISNAGDDAKDNVSTKVQESITNSKDNRKKYLEALGGGE